MRLRYLVIEEGCSGWWGYSIGVPMGVHDLSSRLLEGALSSIMVDDGVELWQGSRHYELSDWLGNVRVVVSDARVPVRQGGVVRGYRAEVVSVGDYYSYGGRMVERSYEVGQAYRWGFNGQEVVGELGRSHYTARFWEYDGRLGRRWEVDPMRAQAPSWSPYRAFFDNPIYYTDVLGLFEGDYYDKSGRYLGTDGIDDGKVYVVFDEGEVASIIEAGGKVEEGSLKSAVELPEIGVRQEMLKVLERDMEDCYREYGGVYGRSENDDKQIVIWAKPGEPGDPTREGSIGINVFNSERLAELYSLEGTFHSHPSGVRYREKGGKIVPYGFEQPPSSRDIENAASREKRLGVRLYNYVIAAGELQVYMYTSQGVLGSMGVDAFRNLGSYLKR